MTTVVTSDNPHGKIVVVIIWQLMNKYMMATPHVNKIGIDNKKDGIPVTIGLHFHSTLLAMRQHKLCMRQKLIYLEVK